MLFLHEIVEALVLGHFPLHQEVLRAKVVLLVLGHVHGVAALRPRPYLVLDLVDEVLRNARVGLLLPLLMLFAQLV